MRSLHILRFLISVFFTFICLVLVYLLAMFITSIVNPESTGLNFFFNLSEGSYEAILTAGSIKLIVFVLQAYSIFILRKFIYDIKPRKVFTAQQVKWLKNVGIFIISATVLDYFAEIFLRLYFDMEAEVSVGWQAKGLYTSGWFTLIIGLFFIFLSTIFKVSKSLKEENELTV